MSENKINSKKIIDDLVIKSYQEGKTCEKIANTFLTSRNMVSDILKKNHVKIKGRSGYHKYKFNELFFHKINNENTAYWLGWLFSDGYNQENKNTVKFQIQKRDGDILHVFKQNIKYNGPIRKAAYGEQLLIFLTSPIFSKKLSELGCIQNKSLILKWPTKVPVRLVRHFLRGYFDGDGCIAGSGNNFQVTILGTENFCQGINKHLSPLIGDKNLESHPNKKTKRYRVGGRRQIEKIYHYLYDNSSIFLARKKQKMEELLCIS